jgi:hypothetical protein
MKESRSGAAARDAAWRTGEEGRRRFLDRLAETGNVSAAARHAGLGRSTLYAWRKQDQDFADAWNDAVIEAIDALEQEARRRAVEGVEQPLLYGGKFVRHEDGSIATIRQYSDRLLEFLLKALRPDWFKAGGAGRGGTRQVEDLEERTDDNKPALTEDERAERVAKLLDAARARGAGPAADE